MIKRSDYTSSQLFELAQKEQRSWIRKRIMAVAYIAQNVLSKEAVARKLHTDVPRIRFWIDCYNQRGLEGLNVDGMPPQESGSVQKARYQDY